MSLENFGLISDKTICSCYLINLFTKNKLNIFLKNPKRLPNNPKTDIIQTL